MVEEERSNRRLRRRDFMKGMAVGAVGMAAATDISKGKVIHTDARGGKQ
jgi:hypothetical protein